MTTLAIYTTAGCHLCELAEAMLNKLSLSHNVTVIPIEIGDDDELVARYGIRIPVVRFSDNTELNWPFEQQDIERKIEQL